MLDVIGFATENGSFTTNNKLDGAAIASGSVANMAGITIDQLKAPGKAVLTDIEEITERLGILRARMNLGASLTTSDLEDLFVPEPHYGLSSGHTRAQDVASIVTIFGPGASSANGKLQSIRNVRLVSDLTANYTGRGVAKAYLLNYDFVQENGVVVHGNNVTFGKETASGMWKFIGDPADAAVGNNYGGMIAGSFSGSN